MVRLAEFKRNIWLEFSLQRIIVMPAILAGILFLSHLLNQEEDAAEYIDTMTSRITWLYIIITLVWGTVLLGRNINEELSDHSWDFQRMSALSGIDMSVGKLFGATAYAWYGGLLLIGAHVGFELYAGHPFSLIAYNVAQFILVTLMAHASVLLFTMLMLRNPLYRHKPRGRVLYSFLVIAYTAPTLFLGSALEKISSVTQTPGQPDMLMQQWYGMEFSVASIALLSLVVYAAWACFGAVRMVSAELQYKQTTFGWPLFLLFMIFWHHGFALNEEVSATAFNELGIANQSYFAIGISVAAIYASILFDKLSIADYRARAHALKNRAWGTLSRMIPWWFSSYVILFAAIAFTLLYNAFSGAEAPTLISLACVLLAAVSRDIALYHLLSFGSIRRVTGAFIVYLSVLYLLLPALLFQLGSRASMALLVPSKDDYHIVTIASLSAQACILMGLCVWRYSRAQAPKASA